MKTALLLLPVIALSLAALLSTRAVAAEPVQVFAAASLGGVLEPVAARWTARSGQPVSLSYAGSSALARQVQQGAPADLFISANSLWMDALATSGDIQPASRLALLTNSLVLIAHGPDTPPIAIEPGFALDALLGDGMLAMAMTTAVPAGIYGKQALTRLGAWPKVRSQIAQTDNVRAALALVARGEARLGIVYASDALAEPRVSVVGHFPADSHEPIIYPAALTTQSKHPQAQAFLQFLTSETARAEFRRAGFQVAD
ncbi:molybdate ABC transporter substrate-binding protein [Halopseudomonas sp.]|uniref:molybdate ABC transporter substrate-binding protein n=1 Tax=Halopseudomonas sp. TaxID=2901191 RepID=UPI00356B3389